MPLLVICHKIMSIFFFHIFIHKSYSVINFDSFISNLYSYLKNKKINQSFLLDILNVGYHQPFQHKEPGHLPYMAVALIPDQSDQRPVYVYESEEPFPIVEVYPYSITNVLITNSLSCKYSFL